MSVIESDLDSKLLELETLLNSLTGNISKKISVDDFFDSNQEVEVFRCKNEDNEVVWVKKNEKLILVFAPENEKNIIWYWCDPTLAAVFNKKTNNDEENLFHWAGTDLISDISTKVSQINKNEPTDGLSTMLLEFDEETYNKIVEASTILNISVEEFITNVLQNAIQEYKNGETLTDE